MPLYGADGQVIVSDRIRAVEVLARTSAPESATYVDAAVVHILAAGLADADGTISEDDAARLWNAALLLRLQPVTGLRHDPGCVLAREAGEAPGCVCTPQAVLSSSQVGALLVALSGRPDGGIA